MMLGVFRKISKSHSGGQMVKTEKIGQPTIITDDASAAVIRASYAKPRVRFLWKGDEQTLYIKFPKSFHNQEYLDALDDVKFIHLLMVEQAWFPVTHPSTEYNPFLLCIGDNSHDEPLLITFSSFDWMSKDQTAEVPEITDNRQQAQAAIFLPDGSTKHTTLLIGGSK
jgi:hypothetical protein